MDQASLCYGTSRRGRGGYGVGGSIYFCAGGDKGAKFVF